MAPPTIGNKRSLIHLTRTVARLLSFSISTGAYRGFRDWNITYERVFEYGETFSIVESLRPLRVLDVAGDLSIFGCFLARTAGCSIDILDMGDLSYCRELRNHMSPEEAARIELIPHTRAEDLSGDRRYDLITCISAIEHFDGDADRSFVKAASRLLRTGGTLVITAPFTLNDQTDSKYRRRTYYTEHGEEQANESFYMRHYSLDDIGSLARDSGLRVEKLIFAGEVVNFYDRVFLYGPVGDSRRDIAKSYVSGAIGRLSPLYPFLFMRESDRAEDFTVGPSRRRIFNPDTFLLQLCNR